MKSPFRLFLPLFAALLLLSGCEKDEIRSYSAPRADEGIADDGPTRLLVGIALSGEDAWFIKLGGRTDIIRLVEPSFYKLLDSLEFTKGNPSLAWKVPPGWVEDRKNPNRVATLRPEGPGAPEIAISKLSAEGFALTPNINRWRRMDLGLGPISWKNVGRVSTARKVGGHEVTVVDMFGPGPGKAPSKATTPPPPPGGGGGAKPAGSPSIKYTKPEGWTDHGPRSIAVARLTVGEGDSMAGVLVTPLRGSMPGGLLLNVNRWRKEVDLPEIGEDDLKKADIRKTRVGKNEAQIVDLQGKDRRGVVAWLERDGQTWFFKFSGPKATVTKHLRGYEKFLESVTFPGAAADE